MQAFARRGAYIGLIARGRERLEATSAGVEVLGSRALVLPGDVADAGAVEEATAFVEAAFGTTNIWVTNAFS